MGSSLPVILCSAILLLASTVLPAAPCREHLADPADSKSTDPAPVVAATGGIGLVAGERSAPRSTPAHPVPEPTTAGLIALGGLLLCLRRRRPR
jgi:hypothetical protein